MNPAIGKNRYCAPGAIAIACDVSTDVAAKAIRDVTGKRAVRRVSMSAIVRSFLRVGGPTLRMIPIALAQYERRTVEGFVAENVARGWNGMFLVEVAGHVLITEGGDVCDNCTVYPLAVARFKGRRKRVKTAWRIVRTEAQAAANRGA